MVGFGPYSRFSGLFTQSLRLGMPMRAKLCFDCGTLVLDRPPTGAAELRGQLRSQTEQRKRGNKWPRSPANSRER